MTDHQYAACYCEENVWHLCADPAVPGHKKQVVWIGSLQSYCPLWCQQASGNPEQPVWWDYHVILLALTDRWRVWDLDTTLPLPVDVSQYLPQTFRDTESAAPLFRIMDSDYYRQYFSSDRTHMRNPDNQWLALPPRWPAIQQQVLTFADMRDFNNDTHGELVGYRELLKRFG